MLTLFDSTGAVLASNDDWDAQDPAAIATGLAPTDPLESMLIATLPAGAYTAVLETKGAPGVALFELYQLGNNMASGVVNLSTRGHVGLGERRDDRRVHPDGRSCHKSDRARDRPEPF